MRVAHLIIFHEDPTLVERLIHALYHPSFDFYLHLDKKVDAAVFHRLAAIPNTYLIKRRMKVNWGGFSQLKAIACSMEEIFASGKEYGFVNLLSGQDYPIKPAHELYEFLLKHPGKSFLMSESPPSPWWKHAPSRFTRYHFVDFGFRGQYRLAYLLSLLMPKRKWPLEGKWYGGPDGAYWILSAAAAKFTYQRLMEDKIQRFFQYTWGPDEFLINTLLMNSPFKDQIINENYHLIDRSLGGTRPKTLDSNDFEMLRRSHKFFARKFDRRQDAAVLDRIDQELLFLPKANTQQLPPKIEEATA